MTKSASILLYGVRAALQQICFDPEWELQTDVTSSATNLYQAVGESIRPGEHGETRPLRRHHMWRSDVLVAH
jgi:hypothetical protein